MKVKDLIEQLQKLDGNLDVVFEDYEGDGLFIKSIDNCQMSVESEYYGVLHYQHHYSSSEWDEIDTDNMIDVVVLK